MYSIDTQVLQIEKFQKLGVRVNGGNKFWSQDDGGLVVNVLAQSAGDVGPSPDQERRCVMHHVEVCRSVRCLGIQRDLI